MKFLTKAILIYSAIKVLNNFKKQKAASSLGSYDMTNELTKIWGSKALYTVVPGLGLAKAVLDTAKTVAKNNSIGKGVNIHGR